MVSLALRMTLRQILEIVSYCTLTTFCVGTTIAQELQLPAKLARQWPRPRLVMPENRDEEYLRIAADNAAVLLGYEHDGAPVYWADTDRAMQSNLPGLSGTGKTTLLLNIVEQDIRRGQANSMSEEWNELVAELNAAKQAIPQAVPMNGSDAKTGPLFADHKASVGAQAEVADFEDVELDVDAVPGGERAILYKGKKYIPLDEHDRRIRASRTKITNLRARVKQLQDLLANYGVTS